jgi:hypothetical protein
LATGVGRGVTWVPRLEDYLIQPKLYKLTGVERLSRPTSGFIPQDKTHRHTTTNMMVLKVEELVCKTYYFFTVKIGSFGFYLKIEMPFPFRYCAREV